MLPSLTNTALRRVVMVVALLNLAYFGVEFSVGLAIGSFALAWAATTRARVGMALAGILLVPALALLWALYGKFTHPVPPEPFALSVTGAGALAVNLFCAFLLARFREHSGSLTRAAFLSARNDAIANVAIIGAGLVTAYLWPSVWPDVIVGLAIAAMNIDAAREVWEAAREEHDAAA